MPDPTPTAPKPTFRLYFFFRPGCGWCEKARPIANKIAAERQSLVIPINLERQPRGARGYVPNGTPGYLLVVGDEDIGSDIGFKTEKQLNKWIDRTLDTIGDDEEDDEDETESESDEEEE